MINIVEYTFQKLFGFIDIKNCATPNRDPDQANCIQKPFHNRHPCTAKGCCVKTLSHEVIGIFTNTTTFVKILICYVKCDCKDH